MAAGKESASLLAGSEPVFDIVCIPCDSEGIHREAEGYCMDCREHFCEQCFMYHRRLSTLKKHRMVGKDNMPLDQEDSVRKDICTAPCIIHKDKIIEYFCPTHNYLGCNVCVTLKHKQCKDVAYIPEVSEGLEHRPEYKTFQRHLDQLIQKANMMFKSSEQDLKASAGLYANFQRDIRTFRKEINTALDRMETGVNEKLEQINKQITQGLQAASREVSRINDELQAIAANFKKLVSKKQNCEMFTLMKNTESKLSELNGIIDELDKDITPQIYTFCPNEKILQMLKATNVLGKLQNASEIRADCMPDIKFKSKRSTETYGISGLCAMSRKKLVVTVSRNDTVKLIDLVSNKITSELQLECPPWTVTATTKAEVAVTQPWTRKILFITCDVKLVVDREVSVRGQCYGIAYYQNKLIVTFNDPGKLEILSMEGEVLQRFEKDHQGRQLLMNPKYVSVNMEEPAMFVSDRANGCLIKLSLSGTVLAEYRDRQRSAVGECTTDQAGVVYLCDETFDKIHLLSTGCTKLKTVLTSADGLLNPSAISFCKTTGRLYIGLDNEDKIKVYQLHY